MVKRVQTGENGSCTGRRRGRDLSGKVPAPFSFYVVFPTAQPLITLGLIADIHADHRALEAALRHLDQLGVATILCAGDLVGYGTHADAVVELLRARAI